VEQAYQQGVGYFLAVSPLGKTVLNFFLPSPNKILAHLGVISPIILVVGFILNKKREFFFIALFFLITFFLVTANITNTGFFFYKSLFYIPAFSMFRVFYTKWMTVFLLFYAILFGFSTFSILSRLKKLYAIIFFLCCFLIYNIISIPLFIGTPIRESIVRGSNNTRTFFSIDPHYEKTLEFIRKLPNNGKILILPLTDFYLQVVFGSNGGAYEGPSTVSFLTSHYSFAGERDFGYQGSIAYSPIIKQYAKEKDYYGLLRVFTLMNIRYILYNTDSRMDNLANGPYYYIGQSFPNTQQRYKEFLTHFPLHLIYKNGTYYIYEIDESVSNPTIFAPQGSYVSSLLSLDPKTAHEIFIDKKLCSEKVIQPFCDTAYSSFDISFHMVNPSHYRGSFDASGHNVLVIQNTFNKNWKLLINGKKVPENEHIVVNGYANGWILTLPQLRHSDKYSFDILLDSQKYFWYGWAITITTIVSVVTGILFTIHHKSK